LSASAAPTSCTSTRAWASTKAVVAATIAATVGDFSATATRAFRHRERTGMGRETVLFSCSRDRPGDPVACVAIVVDGAGLQGSIWYNLANLCGIGLGTRPLLVLPQVGGGRRNPPAWCPQRAPSGLAAPGSRRPGW